ncbi:ECF RNA polymerase sigma factor SigM [bioreactor metagenome]|uniref:ECF RNA polymerase sigma factor SigM n=1 Tax=bioreactor metagenome TaxID=1076179 RepID=A0A644YQE2_9ZZZZ|nr:sigma-70 family RNA polymerase sigma factor [Oscillospiraceae bacterium]
MDNNLEKNFEQFYIDFYPRIYAFLCRLSGNSDLSEDLTQETFYQAYISFHKFKGDSDIFTWLAAIAKYTYFKYLKKNRMDLNTVCLDSIADVYCSGDSESPEEIFQRQQVITGVKRIISKIPEKYRNVVILRIYAEIPFSQIASVLGITENSAKVIYFRAKKMLMEELNDEYNM